MIEMRLVDANSLKAKSVPYIRGSFGRSAKSEDWAVLVKDINSAPAIDPETLPIVKELREKLEQKEQELRNVKYCYDIAKNGERQLRRQVNEITAEWAECVKKLKLVTAERDAAIADLKILSDCDYCKYDCKNYEEDDCRFCGVKKCKCRTCKDGSSWEWRGLVAENSTAESEVQPNDQP